MAEPETRGPRPVTVECYAGYKADVRPTSFLIGSEKRGVEEVIDQWYGPDHTYFKVLADDRMVYILRHDRGEDSWTLAGEPRPLS